MFAISDALRLSAVPKTSSALLGLETGSVSKLVMRGEAACHQAPCPALPDDRFTIAPHDAAWAPGFCVAHQLRQVVQGSPKVIALRRHGTGFLTRPRPIRLLPTRTVRPWPCIQWFLFSAPRNPAAVTDKSCVSATAQLMEALGQQRRIRQAPLHITVQRPATLMLMHCCH